MASQVRYVGSPEHKDHPSEAGAPRLRSDASKCDPALTKDLARNTRALQEGILSECVSEDFEEGFPKYVWSWLDGSVYEARHIRGPQGTYKGYKLSDEELPEDPENKLSRRRNAVQD